MKVQELLDAPPIRITDDLGDMDRYIDNIDTWEIPDDVKNEYVEMRYYVDECFDGERGFEVVSIWFKQKPVMLATRGGRGLSDSEGYAILDVTLYNAMMRYIDSLKIERTDNLNMITPESDYDALGFEYGGSTLHRFYRIESVNPRFKEGDIIIARVRGNPCQFQSGTVETRVQITQVRHHNPNNTYSGDQLDRRWGDGEQRHEMIIDVGNGGMGAHFPEEDAIRLAD